MKSDGNSGKIAPIISINIINNMCVFCKIIAGEIPSYKVYEDGGVLAFLDIHPLTVGHTLVIPKKHYSRLEEMPEEEFLKLMAAVKKIAVLMSEKLGFSDYKLSQNNGPLAGQEVDHVHFHIIPRHPEDPVSHHERKEYAPGEAEEIIKKIIS